MWLGEEPTIAFSYSAILTGNLFVKSKYDIKGVSSQVSKGNEDLLLDTGEKAILIIKWQNPWLNCALLLVGQSYLQVINI